MVKDLTLLLDSIVEDLARPVMEELRDDVVVIVMKKEWKSP